MSLKSQFMLAVETLMPAANYTLGSGQTLPDLYNTLYMNTGNKPSYQDIEQQLAKQALAHVRQQRKCAYPPVATYLDAQVKIASDDPAMQTEGQAQLAAYLSACLAVKASHPKPAEEM